MWHAEVPLDHLTKDLGFDLTMTADLHLANILLRLPLDMRHMTLEQLHARVDDPAKMAVIRQDGAPLDLGVPREVIVPV